MPNQEQLLALLRSVLVIVGTYLTAKGITSEAGWQTFMGAALTGAPIVWSMITNTKASLIRKTAGLDEVSKVEMKATRAGIDMANSAGSTPAATVTVGK